MSEARTSEATAAGEHVGAGGGHGGEGGGVPPRHEEHPRPHGAWLYVGGALAVVAIVVAVALIFHARRAHTRDEAQSRVREQRAGTRVAFVTVGQSRGEREVTLTGEARPYATATLYAKISGYLRAIRVDRGDRVSAGQLIAVITSPETDQQYLAAARDRAMRELTAQRLGALVGPGAVSREEADLATASARVARANVAQYATLRGYEMIRAPFAGTVTARYADPGALVQSATGAQSGALPLVRLSQLDRLRVFVYLDQRDAAMVRVGDPAELAPPERPEVRVRASVTRMAGELDVRTRTMLVEVDVDNARGELLAGGFVNVTFRLRAPVHAEIPSAALVTRGARTVAAVVAPDDTVHFRPVTVVDDDGARVWIGAGLRAGERVAVNVDDMLGDGARVQPVPAPSAPAAPARPTARGGGESEGAQGAGGAGEHAPGSSNGEANNGNADGGDPVTPAGPAPNMPPAGGERRTP